jgi:L-amino acid N-acyltransferase YncA
MDENIRVAEIIDAQEIQRIYSPIVLSTPISFETELPSITEIANRIESTLVQFPWLVCEVGQEIAGYAYASQFRSRAAYQWSAEVTVYVDPKFQGIGIGKLLYRSLFKILVDQGYRTVIGGITLPNPASIALHESLGFVQVATFKTVGYKMGTWHDVGFWQFELQSVAQDPALPVPFSKFRLISTTKIE